MGRKRVFHLAAAASGEMKEVQSVHLKRRLTPPLLYTPSGGDEHLMEPGQTFFIHLTADLLSGSSDFGLPECQTEISSTDVR